jgi:hypothetical protein
MLQEFEKFSHDKTKRIALQTNCIDLAMLGDGSAQDARLGDTHDNTGPVTPSNNIMLAVEQLAPLIAVRDQRGYIYDDQCIVARCELGHIHKYFLKSISNVCLTCTHGSIFAKFARSISEKTLKIPFTATQDNWARLSYYEFINPAHKLVLSCGSKPFIDSATTVRGHTVIILHPTTSEKKIIHKLGKYIPAEHVLMTGIIMQSRREKIYTRAPLPYSDALRRLVRAGDINISESSPCEMLLLENCTSGLS